MQCSNKYYYMQGLPSCHKDITAVICFSDMCDQGWRRLRDGLTITGFVSSILSNISLFISLFIQLLLWKCKDFLLAVYVSVLTISVTAHNWHTLLRSKTKLAMNRSIV